MSVNIYPVKGKHKAPSMKGKKVYSFTAKPKKKTTAQRAKENTKEINKLKKSTLPVVRFYEQSVGTISSYLHSDLISTPNNWVQCFRSTSVPGTDMPRQYNLSGVRVQWAAQCETDASGNQWLQVFLVSLKPKTAAKVIERTTRLSNLTENLDYIYVQAGTTLAGQGNCMFMLNPNLYTVHYNSKQRRIGQTTMESTTEGNVTNIRDSTTRGVANIKFKRVIKNDEYNAEGFRAVDYTKLEPKNHLYLIMLSNAQSTSQIFFTHHSVFTGRCAMTN